MMTSSMLSGERRWASARRGGMTVLGKVAVPKPINLPSQRLENHGLDPNVEIVPKGTHGWGNKSSSSSPNAWGSPNTDGGTGSPSYLNGRPSSGGTGTRPSTAGSDRAQDPVTNAWGSSSRPSSSSGVLTSNQTSQTALRPRSADTRPGSSQLSRFAEPLSDNARAWGGSGTPEKLGVASSKNDGFSLSTGDFPSLGSEKDSSGKNTDSQDHGSHGRPGSSSSGVASMKEHTGDSAGDFSVNMNAKAGDAGSWRKEGSMHEDGNRCNLEKWHADPQPYPNSNIHHSQHFDSWHGPPVNSHPGGPWYRGPPGGPPFGSPIPPGGFPMEPFPYFHPQMPPPPLANPQPVHPANTAPRGGPHPKNGDMYRPHMHDPYARPGMPLRPGFYPGPVPFDNYYGPPPMGFCNSNERDAPFMGMPMGPATYNRYPAHGPTSNPMVSERGETVHPHDARGPYKVLLKQHDNWEGRDREQKWDDNAKTNSLHMLKGDPTRNSSWENGWGADDGIDDEMGARKKALDEGTSREVVVDNRAVPLKVKSPEIVACQNSSDDKFEHVASNFPEAATLKDSSLIQKIEGLNAKARACEAYGSGIISHEDRLAMGDKSFESTIVGGTTTVRKSTHGKSEHHSKMRFNNQEADGWRKNYASHGSEKNYAATQNLVVHSSGKEVSDVNESQVQRPKMEELAKRIKQREKEEEERTRDQRAKALAKLEELNRRTLSGDNSVAEKLDTVPSTIILGRQESSTRVPLSGTGSKSAAPISSPSSNTNAIFQKEKSETVAPSAVQNKIEESSIDESNVKKVEKSASKVSLEQSTPLRQDGNYVDTVKQKRSGYKQKQSGSVEKNAAEKSTPSSITETCKAHSDIAANATICFGSIGDEITAKLESNVSFGPSVTSESLAHHRKKSRNGKNRQKVDEAPSKELRDTVESESERPKTSEAISVRSTSNLTESNQSSNQWKSQNPRRTTRNQQGTKSSDKSHGTDAVVWAPVRSQNKVEVSDESSRNVSDKTLVKSDPTVQNNPKSKRAEMERYIPKPVAKELSHQGSSHQAVVPSNKITSSEIPTESRNGNPRQNKPGKMHGSWRQRGMTESTSNPNPSDNFQESFEDHQGPDEWGDGWTMPENPKPAVNISVLKDHGAIARGKQHQHKGGKAMWGHGHNPDETRTVVSEVRLSESPVAAKENHGVGERSTSHWQPKKESSSLLPQPDKGTSSARSHQSLAEKTNFEEAPGVERPRRERKTAGRRGRPVSPAELGGGLRRNGNGNNSRYGREHESHGEWSGSGKDNKQHYEYQPVGAHNDKGNSFEPPKERPRNSGPRYRERGQGQTRHGGGNFGGRQSGGVQVDGSYE